MKENDMKAGQRVIINDNAQGGTKDYINRVGVLSWVSYDIWVVVFDIVDGDTYRRSTIVSAKEVDLV